MDKQDKSTQAPAKIKTSFMTINRKFMFLIGMLLIFLVALVAAYVYGQEREALARQVSERVATIARNLASNAGDALLEDNILTLAGLVRGAVQDGELEDQSSLGLVARIQRDLFGGRNQAQVKNAGVVRAYLVKNGMITADTQGGNIGAEDIQPEFLSTGQQEPYPVFEDALGSMLYEVRQPVVVGGLMLGDAVLHVRRDLITNVVRQATTKMIAIMMGSAFLGMIILLVIVRLLLKPVGHLVSGVTAVAKGDFTKQIKLSSRDELGELVQAYNDMAGNLRQKEMIQEALGKYTSKELVDQMLTDQSQLNIGGKRVNAVMMFTVLRGLHELSATMDPEEYVGIMNEYLEVETDVILRNQGQIDKFIGDEVMALWGITKPSPDDQFNAAKAGVEIQTAIAKLNADRKAAGKPTFECSIGVHHGSVVAGNMGSSVKMDYTVLGAAVNLTARIGLIAAKGGQTLLSKATADLIRDRVAFEDQPPIALKGIKEPVATFHAVRVIG
jgi:class 3 adenylate cyclase